MKMFSILVLAIFAAGCDDVKFYEEMESIERDYNRGMKSAIDDYNHGMASATNEFNRGMAQSTDETNAMFNRNDSYSPIEYQPIEYEPVKIAPKRPDYLKGASSRDYFRRPKKKVSSVSDATYEFVAGYVPLKEKDNGFSARETACRVRCNLLLKKLTQLYDYDTRKLYEKQMKKLRIETTKYEKSLSDELIETVDKVYNAGEFEIQNQRNK